MSEKMSVDSSSNFLVFGDAYVVDEEGYVRIRGEVPKDDILWPFLKDVEVTFNEAIDDCKALGYMKGKKEAEKKARSDAFVQEATTSVLTQFVHDSENSLRRLSATLEAMKKVVGSLEDGK